MWGLNTEMVPDQWSEQSGLKSLYSIIKKFQHAYNVKMIYKKF